MDGGDADFLSTVSRLGCETHSFDPSTSSASVGHLGNSLASNHGNRGVVSQHKLWLEWRAPKRRRHGTSGRTGGVSHTLDDIMAMLGHHTVRDTSTNNKNFGQTNTPQSLFYPSLPGKHFYLAVAMVTGLCAISDCYGNVLSE